MEQVKLCQDCRFYQRDRLVPPCGLCGHPLLVNPGAGKPTEFCKVQRSYPQGVSFPCGKEGKLWEPKPPHRSLWQRLKERLTHA